MQEIYRNMRKYTKRKPFQKICLHCESSYEAGVATSKFCSKGCFAEFSFKQKQESLLKGIEGVDYVIDLWNGYATPRIYGKWFKAMHPERTLEEYKSEFPNAPLYCSSDKEATTINGGKHMKDEKYRKMFSERIKGQKNPMSRSRASKQKRKETSPFSIDFYRKRFPGKTEDEYTKMVSERVSEFLKDRKTWNQVGYWMEKGMTREEAVEEIAKRQTRDLSFFQSKYGEEEGRKQWLSKIEKWSHNFQKRCWSKVSQELFSSLYELLTEEDREKVRFATLNPETGKIKDVKRNFEARLILGDRIVLPDFIIGNKIIEFDGVYWHGKNKIDSSKTDREKKRDELLIKNGFEVLHINELDWYKNPEEVINKCKNFLCELR